MMSRNFYVRSPFPPRNSVFRHFHGGDGANLERRDSKRCFLIEVKKDKFGVVSSEFGENT